MSSTISTNAGGSVKSSRCGPGSGLFLGRLFFITCLGVVASILGYAAFTFLTNSEIELADRQFDSIADRALDTAQAITRRKRLGTVSMASVASYSQPNAEAWPFVVIEGYEQMSTNIIETSDGRAMGFCPLVKPGEEQRAFEEFAYGYYDERFPGQGMGISSFGRGVYGTDPSLNTSDNRYHDTDGSTSYGSPNNITAPMLQINFFGPHPALMLNLHWEQTRGEFIDAMMACAADRAVKNDTSIECLFITDTLLLVTRGEDANPGPGGLIMQPIYPANDPTVLVGLISSSILWKEVLEDVFTEGVSGIDCVLQTTTQTYTYGVLNGVAFIRGKGDLHDRKFDSYAQSRSLTSPETGEILFADSSAAYTLTLYPTNQLFDVYSTSNPWVATVGAVCIVIFTSLVFFLYDFFVRQSFIEKEVVLQAKRQFMCFVSHEVRTPLNSVCMGLKFMQEEVEGRKLPEAATASSNGGSDTNADSAQATATTTDGGGPSEDSGMTGKQVREMMKLNEEILSNAESAVDVLNDFLNYDKIEMGKLNLELTIIPIWTLIERTMVEFHISAEAKSIKFTLDFSPLLEVDPPYPNSAMKAADLPHNVQELRVVGDTIRITQVLRNLVSNGLKFTPEGGSLTITVSRLKSERTKKQSRTDTFVFNNDDGDVTFEERGFLQIDVADTGAGLSPEQSAKLFNDGVQFNVNELQAGKGSGLGLYIAKGIVEQHGGALSAASEGLGKGTTFTLKVPLFHVPDDTLPSYFKHLLLDKKMSERAIKLDNGEEIEKESLRILVVDDSVSNRKLLTRLLERRGHVCEQVVNGVEAVNKVRISQQAEQPYDAIMMDYEMPEMDGPTACKHIRDMGCDSFIVGLTGNVMPEDIEHFKSCGANGVLPKPLKMTILEEMWVEYGVTGSSGSS